MSRKICVVTGSRAEYGLLRWVMQGIKDDPELTLQIIATGMHLSPEFGLTYKVIEANGFSLDAKVEMLLSSDTGVGVTKSIGLGVIGFAEALDRLAPDMVVVLGDRFEILAVAQAAMILQIPLAHLGGGDTGAGTYDNIIRHCVTKMASIHFVTHEEARHRVIQLGEHPERVFCYGATSVDNIDRLALLSREELEQDLKITFKSLILLVTFHPLTMDEGSSEWQLLELLGALDVFIQTNDYSVIFTKSNADNGGRALNQILASYVSGNPDSYLFDSLGQLRYLSLMQQASIVIGNSSSGIYEAPYLKTPTVDIGSRQRGRTAPNSVIRSAVNKAAIINAIEAAMTFKFKDVVMIYGDGNASKKILAKMKEVVNKPGLVVKGFVDREWLE